VSIGKKDDKGKSPIIRGFLNYFPRAVAACADLSLYGAEKYDLDMDERNFALVEDGVSRYTDALGRHQVGEASEVIDPESGFHHAVPTAWNAMARLELILEALEKQEAAQEGGTWCADFVEHAAKVHELKKKAHKEEPNTGADISDPWIAPWRKQK